MSTKKLLPENIQIPTPAHLASATGLMGFSNTLPECPSRLPDGTILDYSAVDETWKDVDFPEREVKTETKPQTMEESRASLEASFFQSFQESKLSHVTPAHILKHMTRVQGLAALVPTQDEAVEAELAERGDSPDMRFARKGMSKAKAKMSKFKRGTPGWHAAAGEASAHQFQLGQMKAAQKFRGEAVEVVKFDKVDTEEGSEISEAVYAVNAVLESNDLVVEADSMEGYLAGLQEILETYELSEADHTALQELFGVIGKVVGAGVDAARKVVGGAVSAVGGAASKVGQAVTGGASKPDDNEAKEPSSSLKKWKHKKEGVEQDEASPEAKANKAKRRAGELDQRLAHNKAVSAAAAKPDPLNPNKVRRLSAAVKPEPKPFVKWQSKSATA